MNYLCSGDSTSNLVTIKGLVSDNSIKPGDELSFSVLQTITNPGEYIAPGEFKFVLISGSGGLVD